MPELRIDPLSGDKVLVAGERATRPGAGLQVEAPAPVDRERDPFAEGHEDRTPPELYALRPKGSAPDAPGWSVRVVPNRYPALAPDAPAPEPDGRPELFASAPARGAHEVIVNGPAPVATLGELGPAQLATAVGVWRERMRAHGEAACVHLIVNERPEAGASLPHSHAQLYALGFVPHAVARERERFSAHAVRTMGGNLLQDLVQEEVRRRERLVAIDDEAVLLVPYGGRMPYQLMLAPRRPRARFEEEDGPFGAVLLHAALERLARALGAPPPLNLWVRTAPRGSEHFCWRVDVVPRLAQVAGLELGTGVQLNPVAPEAAAAALRDA